MNCNGCGVELDPSEEQVNASVDQILQTSLKDAEKKAGVCPLCGHSKEVPYSHRKTVLFGLLLACLLVSIAGGIFVCRSRQTQRNAAANEVVVRMSTNADIAKLLGTPSASRLGCMERSSRTRPDGRKHILRFPCMAPWETRQRISLAAEELVRGFSRPSK